MLLHSLTINDRDTWNATLALLPCAHVLQTWEWGDFKAQTTGWKPRRIAFMYRDEAVAMAQILTRQEGPFKIMYVPKGPALDYTNAPLRTAVLDSLIRIAKDSGAIFIKLDPDIITGTGVPGTPDEADDPVGMQIAQEWAQAGLVYSRDQVQFRNSLVVDLSESSEDVLASMKQKTRYNVRLGPRRDLDVRFGSYEDLDLLYDLYAETARRDGFVIRPINYYREAWGQFMQAGLAQPIIAEYRGNAIAHVIIFGFAKRAWYFYGASSNDERNRMPAYMLQWEAMQWAQRQGMASYDFWGAPENFADENDPLSGVFRFKQGFGGTVERRIGAWDYPANPLLYRAYTRLMPLVIGVMRRGAWRRLMRR